MSGQANMPQTQSGTSGNPQSDQPFGGEVPEGLDDAGESLNDSPLDDLLTTVERC